jgi:CP family cyanate transporter-like MFS transporter
MTAYMGLKSSLAYCVFAWLPTMLIERSGTQIGRDQRPSALAMLTLSVVGLLGCLLLPVASLPLWVVLLGLGQGGNFSVALLCIVLRAGDSAQAGKLSAMAQGGATAWPRSGRSAWGC